ncbi:MAG: tRNA pseudouridine(55) synthase TruB [Patescibacteria group bacterium]|jgi:tRNA pseudouridine55 synthase
MPLLINKPKGYTSHDIVNIVRKKLHTKKVGHAGTLDPLATGLLIVLVGREETKKQAEFMAGDKEYIAEITLGKTSVTDDAEGPLQASSDPSNITQVQIELALKKFIGAIKQTPPLYSAIKQHGQPLHRIMRRREKSRDALQRVSTNEHADKMHDGTDNTITVQPREISIFNIELLEITLPVVKIKVNCSKGTYIRSLARDIGKELGVGAYLSGLTRTKSGNFSLEQAVSLDDFKNN